MTASTVVVTGGIIASNITRMHSIAKLIQANNFVSFGTLKAHSPLKLITKGAAFIQIAVIWGIFLVQSANTPRGSVAYNTQVASAIAQTIVALNFVNGFDIEMVALRVPIPIIIVSAIIFVGHLPPQTLRFFSPLFPR